MISAQISLVVTWLCLLVGESLFNVATTTGAISFKRQVLSLASRAHMQLS